MRKTISILAALALLWAFSATAQAQSSLEGYSDQAGAVQNNVQGGGPASVSDSSGSLPFTGLDLALIASTDGHPNVAPTEHAYLPGPNESATAAASDWQPHAGAGASLRQRLFEGSGWTIFRLLVDVLVLVVGNVAALVGAEAADTGDDGKYVIWLFPVLVCLLLAVRGHY